MSKVIVRDPEILGGHPVFRGTRVPVETLFELEDGLTLDEIVEEFPSLDKADLIEVLEERRVDAPGPPTDPLHKEDAP